MSDRTSTIVRIPSKSTLLEGELNIPQGARGLVIFAHGSGSSRHSPRNQSVARTIREGGVGTLLFDLLTQEEEAVDIHTRHLRFDIALLAERLRDAAIWAKEKEAPATRDLRLGCFGSSTGAAAALVAAAVLGDEIGTVVSRGGRPDLAGQYLPRVTAPTLLIVGSLDEPVIQLNEEAFAKLRCVKEMRIISGATHLFEEPGTLEQVAQLATQWFGKYLRQRAVGVGE